MNENDKIPFDFRLWEALKQKCCIKPEQANTIVFLGAERFLEAVGPVIKQYRNDIQREAREAAWQPIETAPKDGTAILVYGPELLREHTGHCMVVRWQTTEFSTVPWWTISDGKFGPYDLRGPSPTHWMPLPDIPIEAAANIGEGGGDAKRR